MGRTSELSRSIVCACLVNFACFMKSLPSKVSMINDNHAQYDPLLKSRKTFSD